MFWNIPVSVFFFFFLIFLFQWKFKDQSTFTSFNCKYFSLSHRGRLSTRLKSVSVPKTWGSRGQCFAPLKPCHFVVDDMSTPQTFTLLFFLLYFCICFFFFLSFSFLFFPSSWEHIPPLFTVISHLLSHREQALFPRTSASRAKHCT